MWLCWLNGCVAPPTLLSWLAKGEASALDMVVEPYMPMVP